MSKKHYVVTCRSVRKVSVEGLADQYWYEHDNNPEADVAVPYMHCGKYVEADGKADRPFFYSPGGETEDYPPVGNSPAAEQLICHGGSHEMLTELFTELENEKKDLLVFMFGYHNPFVKEFKHIELLHEKYVAPEGSVIGRILMVTWPSQGFGEYNQEIEHLSFLKSIWKKITGKANSVKSKINSDAVIAGHAQAIFLLKLQSFISGRYKNSTGFRPEMHYIVQSMANHVLEKTGAALNRMNRLAQAKNIFKNLLLTSPDIRSDIFEKSPDYVAATTIGETAVVVYSPDDPILKLGKIAHPTGPSRLGLDGPEKMENIPANTKLLEVRQEKITLPPSDISHRYFEYNNIVINRYNDIFKNVALPAKSTLNI
jgi:hypothetical protein